MSEQRNALVVGGGISGASAAIELARRGFETKIVEREPVWHALGSGITLMGPALRALNRMGVLERCFENGVGVDEFRICAPDSEVVEVIPLPPPEPGLPGMLGMTRPELHRILGEYADEQGVEVKLGAFVADFENGPDGVRVTLSDGEEGIYDLLVAADGFRSATRAALVGEIEPVFRRQGVFRAVLPRPAEADAAFYFVGPAASGLTLIGVDSLYMYCDVPAASAERPAQEDLPGLMRGHLTHLSGMAGELRDQIEDPAKVDYRPMETLLLPAPTYRGRVVVIGDAAHTTTPQLASGGAMCLEDSIALAEELARADSIDVGLERYSERRFGRCEFVVEASARLSALQMDPADADGSRFTEAMGSSVAVLAQEF
ncbi:MAG: FAD-dependent monooxygenase [Actinobacteria bacterium]|nr:FAD-dependent monooxygenase [Actinomycetota bacterium]